MKRLMYTFLVIPLLTIACTKDNFIYSGISNGQFNGNTLEYMATDSYNWDSTLILIQHAGDDMVRLFRGEDPEHKEITFLGITNHSIRRYILHQGYKRVTDLDKKWCRKILKQHIIDGKLRRKDIPAGHQGEFGTVGSGGKIFKTLAGDEVWIYLVIEEQGFGAGEFLPKHIYVNFITTENYAIASGDIESNNAIIHALEYKFTIGDSDVDNTATETK